MAVFDRGATQNVTRSTALRFRCDTAIVFVWVAWGANDLAMLSGKIPALRRLGRDDYQR